MADEQKPQFCRHDAVHAVAPTVLDHPAGQVLQDVAPGKANEPATHAVHDVEPEAP